MKNKIVLHTLGCKLNFSETSTIGNQFLSKGFEIVDFDDDADIYLFNTCTVTENADRECRQLVRRALRKNPAAFIIVTGCYAQLKPDEISGIYGVDAVVGNNEKFNLFSILKDFEKKELSCIHISPTKELIQFSGASSSDADSRTRAYLKIQDGCDYTCTFCTIPLARGNSRSQSFDEAIINFTNLVKDGYKEIILTGVNVGDYSGDGNSNLYNLLKELIKIGGDFRIRISSIEPNLLTDEIIDLTASSEKLCNHFHIPLQSGSNKVLKAMQRRYSVEHYEELIYKIKDKIEDAAIGVDVIVGFPGETEEEFIATNNFLRDLPITYLHVFTYSERPDTTAVNLPGSVKVEERKRRNKILRSLSERKRSQFYANLSGTHQEVLFENSEIDKNMMGFTSNYVRVKAIYDEQIINNICDIKITEVENGVCNCELLDIKNSIDLVDTIT